MVTSSSRSPAPRPDIVVLDGTWLSDCGIEAFKAELPERFIECGIAEAALVSGRPAGWHSTASCRSCIRSPAFLSTRANEHIYNNRQTEAAEIIYTANARRRRARRARPFAPVGARHLGDRFVSCPG